MIDLAPLGATMEQAATGVLAIAGAAILAMAVWDWLRARIIAQWDRDYRR